MKIECSVDGCIKTRRIKGYCVAHYAKHLKYGDPLHYIKERHYMKNTSEYHTWTTMKQRCYNKKAKSFSDYGGRGISVCEKWRKSFISFIEDMGMKPFPEAQIDRKDNDGNYEPGNCRWTTLTINAQNRRSTKLSKNDVLKIRTLYSDGIITQKELGGKFNISHKTVSKIVRNERWVEK